MRVIHKQAYDLNNISEEMSICVPAESELLSVGEQYGQLTFWYSREKEETCVMTHRVRIVGTGRTIQKTPEDKTEYKFMGTVVFSGGSLILHVFECCCD